MNTQQPHDYGPPPPGQASARDLVCRKCGARRSVAGMTECAGKHVDTPIETAHDYDPF